MSGSQNEEGENDEFTQVHPFEFLLKQNNAYKGCNSSMTKDFSSVSKVKLAFKKFNVMKVPKCFQESYQKERTYIIKNHTSNLSEVDETQKKLWKDHNEIISRYKNRKNKISNRIWSSKNKENSKIENKFEKSSFFLKKISDKGADLKYDQVQLQKEVVSKLQKLSRKKPIHYLKSSTQIKRIQSDKVKENSDQKASNFPEDDKLEAQLFQSEKEMIGKYEKIIKKAEVSISTNNIVKTTKLLNQMKNIINSPFQ